MALEGLVQVPPHPGLAWPDHSGHPGLKATLLVGRLGERGTQGPKKHWWLLQPLRERAYV